MGNIKEVYWISKIELSRGREENIKDRFLDQTVNFDYPNSVEEFDDLLELYDYSWLYWELFRVKYDFKLNAMDDVSGLADRSDKFAHFLTVSRKYGLTCVYIFHTIYTTRQNWQMMSQTKIFNFFTGSVHASSIIRILSSFASRYKNTNISHWNLWINRLNF